MKTGSNCSSPNSDTEAFIWQFAGSIGADFPTEIDEHGMKNRMMDGIEVELGSGNVFADLGLPDASKLKIKSGLVFEKTPDGMRFLLLRTGFAWLAG